MIYHCIHRLLLLIVVMTNVYAVTVSQKSSTTMNATDHATITTNITLIATVTTDGPSSEQQQVTATSIPTSSMSQTSDDMDHYTCLLPMQPCVEHHHCCSGSCHTFPEPRSDGNFTACL
ncbi:uncharacterized protein BX664DRAFT_367811 [Halteromyces radiatus]|uniref:uncharacterized protein n=1 Tax=Halteromyces radiatus TaxID=101107 RepID=UPI00222004C5|nr:uncharacterized protein BX664DRAFT_367811 [Halteromyces radiatus]KAI8098977.1 hypothetical protein BX664DRAFT_367811 [Halteromyces radiatus]